MALLGAFMTEFDREVVCMLNMKADGTPINGSLISIGSIDKACLMPRNLFVPALLSNSRKFIIMHNHVSGNCHPSKLDIEVTERIKEAAELIDLPMLDHIIVGNVDSPTFYSMKADDFLKVPYARIRYDPNQIFEAEQMEKDFVAEQIKTYKR